MAAGKSAAAEVKCSVMWRLIRAGGQRWDMGARKCDRVVHGGEEPAGPLQLREHTDGLQYLDMTRTDALEDDRDAATLQLADDLAECLRTGGVEDTDAGHAQDDDLDARRAGQDG